jgi:transposase-like protein
MAQRGKPCDRAKERFWRRMLCQWRRSGQSVRAFCAQHGLAEPSFYTWRRTLTQRDQVRRQARGPGRQALPAQQADSASDQPVFVPVRLLAPAAALEVLLSSGRLLRVPTGFDAATLRQLLAVLEEAPPC